MKVTITLQQLWFNATLLNFFFRTQAIDTLEEIMDFIGARESESRFNELSEAVEGYYSDLEEFEEDCYDLSAQEILDQLEIGGY